MGEKYDHAKHLTGAQQQQMSHQAELKTKGLIHTTYFPSFNRYTYLMDRVLNQTWMGFRSILQSLNYS